MARSQRIVTLREMRGSRPGRVLLATSDPAVVRAVARAMARRLAADTIGACSPPGPGLRIVKGGKQPPSYDTDREGQP